MKIRKHHITLHDFPLEKGKISLKQLKKVADMVECVASGSLRIVMEGISRKKGPKPAWLENAVNFQLTGIYEGSTGLAIEASLLGEFLELQQLPIFGRTPETLATYTGIDLAVESFEQAFDPDKKNDDLLDKYLLKEMRTYRSLFNDEGGRISISSAVRKQPLQFDYKSFDRIKKLEKNTPPPAKARITGVLDLMQYSKDLIQLNTEKGIIRALITDDVSFQMISGFFGKKVTIEGMANYKPSGNIGAIEMYKLRPAAEDDRWFETPHSAIKEQLDFKELRAKQKYEGTQMSNIIGQWPGDESIDELLEMRKK